MPKTHNQERLVKEGENQRSVTATTAAQKVTSLVIALILKETGTQEFQSEKQHSEKKRTKYAGEHA